MNLGWRRWNKRRKSGRNRWRRKKKMSAIRKLKSKHKKGTITNHNFKLMQKYSFWFIIQAVFLLSWRSEFMHVSGKSNNSKQNKFFPLSLMFSCSLLEDIYSLSSFFLLTGTVHENNPNS
jgi:hypothetical protein